MDRAPLRVVAALIFAGDRLLVCQRKEHGLFPLKWEFPGGKVNSGEGHFAALKRELKEELGIEVQKATEVARYRHLYSDPLEVELVFFRVHHYKGAVANLAFKQILWVKVQELRRLDFLEGDRALIERLLPQEGRS